MWENIGIPKRESKGSQKGKHRDPKNREEVEIEIGNGKDDGELRTPKRRARAAFLEIPIFP